MRWFSVLTLLFVVGFVSIRAEDEEDESLAKPCDPEACELPDCRYSSTNIPGELNARNTPQFVTVAFDGGINVNNIETYRRLIYGRKNSNGCNAGSTFYITHEYTNYQLVNELYNNGFEIGLNSISHLNNQQYWAGANYNTVKEEFGDQMILTSHFANIPYTSIHGVRMPLLQMTGNSSFEVMRDFGLSYDISWPTTAFTNPGLWPYTLDYASTQDCIVPPCPTASIPGAWVYPIITWTDLDGYPCSFVDACYSPPSFEDEDAWYRFILTNFERHYFGNRAPFGVFIHEWFLSAHPAIYKAVEKFLNLINNLEDAFMVNSNEVIEWVKHPVPITEYKQKTCPSPIVTACDARTCHVVGDHNNMDYWMTICNVCPQHYPWVGNPLGL